MKDSEHDHEYDCVEMLSESGIKLYLEFPKQAEANDIKVPAGSKGNPFGNAERKPDPVKRRFIA